MAALLVGEKYSCTPSTLRFSTFSRLALEQNFSFLDFSFLDGYEHGSADRKRDIKIQFPLFLLNC